MWDITFAFSAHEMLNEMYTLRYTLKVILVINNLRNSATQSEEIIFISRE